MERNTWFPNYENPRFRIAALATLIATGLLLLAGLGGSAIAGPVNKDGKIYACYKVKGKPRGAMRVLFKGKRCKRGERRVAWVAASSSNATQQSGSTGQPGSVGQQGAAGEDDSELSAQVHNLNLKVEGLEAILKGVTNDDLVKAVAATPLVEDVCGQVEELTGRSNALLGLLDTLDALNVLSLPLALPAFEACPEP
ncbi:MAG TPA: hypothetical protein VF255_02520 [Solirubrobacterales bacterium]